MLKFAAKLQKYLHMSKKSSNFERFFAGGLYVSFARARKKQNQMYNFLTERRLALTYKMAQR